MTAVFEAIDHDALRRAEIPLTNTSQALKDDVADTAVMLILSTTHELVTCHSYVQPGKWGNGSYPLLPSLKGKRAEILGFGVIGQEIAARLNAMAQLAVDNLISYFQNKPLLTQVVKPTQLKEVTE